MDVINSFAVDNVDKLVLKTLDICEWEIVLTFSQIEYLKKNNFFDIKSIIKHKSDKPYFKFDGKLYVVLENLQGMSMKLKNLDEGVKAATLIAQFHNAGQGFVQPSGVKGRAFWSKNIEKYRMFTINLEKYLDYINYKDSLNYFEKYTKEYVDILLFRAKECMKVFKSPVYIDSLEKSMKKRELCINDISSSTFKVIGERHIINNIFSIGYNMVEEDIADIIKRIINECGNPNAFEEIVNEYTLTRELGLNSEVIIRSIVSYPLDSIKIILKYFDDMEYSDGLVKKFKKHFNNDDKTYILGV